MRHSFMWADAIVWAGYAFLGMFTVALLRALLKRPRIWHNLFLARGFLIAILSGQPIEDAVQSLQGLETIWVLYAPSRLREGSWEDKRQGVGEHLIDTLATYAPNFRRALVDWTLFTPLDLEQRVGLTDGNIRHIDIIPHQMFARRPLPGWAQYRTPIPQLYLCGTGTHPGGEVTGAPGHNASQAILADMSR